MTCYTIFSVGMPAKADYRLVFSSSSRLLFFIKIRLSSCLHGSSSSCLHQKQATVTKKTPYDFQEAGDHVRNGAVFFVLETLLHIERIIDPSATHFQEYIDGIFEDVEEGEFDIDDDIIL